MATRPIFLPAPGRWPYVKLVDVEFKWHAGFAKAQAQKSIRSLHEAARARGHAPLLEISSKSPDQLGIDLSAFNLTLSHRGHSMSVECAFQGSKEFEHGGPYHDLYAVSSREARQDERLRSSGKLIAFRLLDEEFPTQPVTAFYDWLYISALIQNPELARRLEKYAGFTDIAFNPERSWNCQARSAALYVSLEQMAMLDKAMTSIDDFLQVARQGPDDKGGPSGAGGQLRLPY